MFGGFFSTLVGKLVIGVASVATATGGASAAGINVQELLGGGIPFSPEQRIEIIRSAVETEDLPAIEDLAGSLELNPTDGFALLDASDASEPSVDPDDTTGTTGTTVPDDGEEPDDTTGTTVTGDDNNDETDDEQDDETDDEQDDEADALRADHAAAVAAEEDHLADQLSHLVADRVDAETDAAERIERIEDDAAQDLTDLEAERASDIAAVEADLIAALAQIGADERAASADFDAAIVALDAGLAAALAALGT